MKKGKKKSGWKEFFRPTTAKIILTIILGFILLNLFLYSTMKVSCGDPPCKNYLLEKIGFIANIIPFLIYLVFLKLSFRFNDFPFPINMLFPIFILIIMPILWAYFLSCLIIFIYNKFVRKK